MDEGKNLGIIGYSRGSISAFNMACHLTDEQRDHLFMFAIAPAKYIPRWLCRGAQNYVSKGDGFAKFFSYLPGNGQLKEKNHAPNVIFIEAHPNANGFRKDHSFDYLRQESEKDLRGIFKAIEKTNE